VLAGAAVDRLLSRLPAVTADLTAAWVAEGAEIPINDLQTAEVEVVTKKVTGSTVVTSELAGDSSPEATSKVGRGLARDVAREIDAALQRSRPACAQASGRRFDPCRVHRDQRPPRTRLRTSPSPAATAEDPGRRTGGPS
jgi:hypothetical protein